MSLDQKNIMNGSDGCSVMMFLAFLLRVQTLWVEQYSNKNIAIVPGTENIPINIININNGYSPPGIIPDGPCTNCEYYADNTGGLSLQYDGFTTVMTGWLHVVPCEGYHVKMGVADKQLDVMIAVFLLKKLALNQYSSTPINTFTS